MVCTIALGHEHSVTSRNEEAKLHHSMKQAHFYGHDHFIKAGCGSFCIRRSCLLILYSNAAKSDRNSPQNYSLKEPPYWPKSLIGHHRMTILSYQKIIYLMSPLQMTST